VLKEIVKFLHKLFWEYGTCGGSNTRARRHRIKRNVQLVLWKIGEQGHKKDFWHDFDSYWWNTFKAVA